MTLLPDTYDGRFRKMCVNVCMYACVVTYVYGGYFLQAVSERSRFVAWVVFRFLRDLCCYRVQLTHVLEWLWHSCSFAPEHDSRPAYVSKKHVKIVRGQGKYRPHYFTRAGTIFCQSKQHLILQPPVPYRTVAYNQPRTRSLSSRSPFCTVGLNCVTISSCFTV